MRPGETLEALGTSPTGLTGIQAQERLAGEGPNLIREAPRPGILALFLRQVSGFLVLLLLGASLVSALLGEIFDALVIAAVVLINGGLGVLQESRAERALASLKQLSAPWTTAIRQGEPQRVRAQDLVKGDVVVLAAGDRIPADLRVLEARDLKIDESTLTGESEPVTKDIEPVPPDASLAERRCLLFAGTTAVYGRGLGVVYATGMDTELGRLAASLQEIREDVTPLQRNLGSLGKSLGVVVVALAGLLFLAGVLLRGGPPLEYFLASVGLAVAAVPEGLPAVVTIVLAVGVSRMARRNAIMRRLAAVETLGSTTVICSDKTGTLTQNRMTATHAFTLQGGLVPLDEASFPHELGLLMEGLALNSDATVSPGGIETGDPTETALLRAALRFGFGREEAGRDWPRLGEIPFDSARKRMTTVHRSTQGGYVQWTKGAPEVVLGLCDRILGKPLDDEDRDRTLEAVATMARDALRVVAVAYRDLPSENPDESSMVFLGLIGLQDPPRPGAKDAVALTRRAGIIPIMITGDHVETAVAIARALGIMGPGDKAVTGRELDALDDRELQALSGKARVYARVSPEHKVRIVSALKAQGHVVAMTGDGVNDAPALKRADVGVAMGRDGTDVAREAADMVLADDDYSTIVAAVEEGRVIFSNIRGFVSYLLSTNLGEVIAVLGTVLAGYPLPLRPAQLLWLNLVTDSFPALALGLERGSKGVMDRPPRAPGEPLLGARRWRRVTFQGVFVAVVPVIALLAGLDRGIDFARTMAFTALAIAEILRAFTARSDTEPFWTLPLSRNPYLLPAAALSFLLVLVPLYIGPIARVFRAVPLLPGDWLFVGLIAVIPAAMAEVQKAIARRGGGS
jgi:Ca2+-transporting ATPase